MPDSKDIQINFSSDINENSSPDTRDPTCHRPVPAEIITRIVSYIDKPPASWLTVSQAFYDSVGSKIYKTIPFPILNHRSAFTVSNINGKGPTRRKNVKPIQSLKSFLLGKTIYLYIEVGASTDAPSNITQLKRLEVIRFRPSISNTYQFPLNRPDIAPLKALPHHTAVYRHFSLSESHTWPIDSLLPSTTLKRCILIYTTTSPKNFLSRDWSIFRVSFNEGCTTDLVLIFDPQNPSIRFRPSGEHSAPSRHIDPDFGGSWVTGWIAKVVHAIIYWSGKVLIVNAGAIDKISARVDKWDEKVVQDKVEKVLRAKLEKTMLYRQKTEKEVEGRNKDVMFMGMGEFVDTQDWEGVLEEAEAQAWKGGQVGIQSIF